MTAIPNTKLTWTNYFTMDRKSYHVKSNLVSLIKNMQKEISGDPRHKLMGFSIELRDIERLIPSCPALEKSSEVKTTIKQLKEVIKTNLLAAEIIGARLANRDFEGDWSDYNVASVESISFDAPSLWWGIEIPFDVHPDIPDYEPQECDPDDPSTWS